MPLAIIASECFHSHHMAEQSIIGLQNEIVWSAISQLLQSAEQECKFHAQVVQGKGLCELCGLDQICLCPADSHPAGLPTGVL